MKRIVPLLLLPVFFLAASCGNDNGNGQIKTDSTAVPWPDELKGLVEFDLSESGISAAIMIPDTTVGKPHVEIQSYGEVDLDVGDFYRIKIGEVPEGGGLAARKTDIAEDLLFTSEILEEGKNFIMYRSDLPDDSGTFFHFYVVMNINGVNYEIQDNEDGTYPEKPVKRMMEAAKFIRVIGSGQPA